MNYRKDKRTVEQFAQDIKDCSYIEKDLMILYVSWLNRNPARVADYWFEDFGCDNSGELIKEEGKVSTKADFLLHKPGFADRRIEIKFSRKDNETFHFKLNQLRSYVKNDVCIVNWMGIDTPNKRFCIYTPAQIKQLIASGDQVIFWDKPCIRIQSEGCKWQTV